MFYDMDHYLSIWKPFLEEDDYDFLLQYINNIKNNIDNYGVINIYGPGSKSLENDCTKYLNKNPSIFTTRKHIFLPNEIKILDNQIFRVIQIKSPK